MSRVTPANLTRRMTAGLSPAGQEAGNTTRVGIPQSVWYLEMTEKSGQPINVSLRCVTEHKSFADRVFEMLAERSIFRGYPVYRARYGH